MPCLRRSLIFAFSVLVGSAVVADPIAPRDPKASALGREYQAMENLWHASGRLRSDRAPRDAAYDARQLSHSFAKIALEREYEPSGYGTLIRWSEPVRMKVVFGPSVPADDRAADHARITRYARHLSSVSGHPIGMVKHRANFHVVVASHAELKGLRGFLETAVPQMSAKAMMRVTRLPPDHLCMVVTVPHTDRSRGIARAVAIVRAEHPPTMRRSCIEEELAQGMGLPNDYAGARPSIFNDNEEFGVLTRHDEALLRILYDRRLRPGMTKEEIMPLLPNILRDSL